MADQGKVNARVEQLFFKSLESKTGWGRNEIKTLFRSASVQALREHIDSKSLD